MVRAKNILMTIGVTGLLIAALFVLFPGSASAARVTGLTAGPIESDGSFTVVAQVSIPAGEHIPLEYAHVLITDNGASAFSSNEITGNVPSTGTYTSGTSTLTYTGGSNAQTLSNACDTRDMGATATIIGVTTNDPDGKTIGTFTGQGYSVALDSDPNTNFGYNTNYGYGLGYSATGDAFSGYDGGTGYGYGYATKDITATVTIKVSGCLNALKAFSSDFGNTAVGFDYFLVQAFVGGDSTHGIHSFPTTGLFVNPDATGTPGAGTARPTADGFTVTGGSINAGQQVTVNLPGTGVIQSASFTTTTSLPNGATFKINQGAASGSGGFFGVSSLDTQFPGGKAFQFQPQILLPDGTTVNPPTPITIRIQLDASYLNGLGADKFVVWAYDNSGGPKGANLHPSVAYQAAEPAYTFDITINHFSSFAAGGSSSAPASDGGSGGGGGASTVTTTKTQTVTPITQTTTTTTPTETVTSTSTDDSKDGKKQTPGIELGILAVALAGAAIVIRRRL